VDPEKQEVTTFGGDVLSGMGTHKWYGGTVGSDNCVYGVPLCAPSVIKIDPARQQVTTIGDLPAGGHKWHGAVASADGTSIIGIPSNADTVLRIDVDSQELSQLPFEYSCAHRADRKYKYLGGVLGPDDNVYAIPSDADRVLRINPRSGECTEIGESLLGRVGRDHNKYQNGFLADDGRIYAIPLKADRVLCIDPQTEEVSTIGDEELVGFEKWEGGVLAENGAMYCMPLNAKHVLKIEAAQGSNRGPGQHGPG
jgi:hypothetical protein